MEMKGDTWRLIEINGDWVEKESQGRFSFEISISIGSRNSPRVPQSPPISTLSQSISTNLGLDSR
jgi:hypothetical protein